MGNKVILQVKGLSYRSPKDIAAARLLDKGDKVVLQRELDNMEDQYAIKVLTRPGNFIGYLDKSYTKMLSQHFDCLLAEVETIKHTEIPYIYLEITIADSPVISTTIITNPSELSAHERMMILEDIVCESSRSDSYIPEGYGQSGFYISWTEELPRVNILRAKKCKPGDPLKLIRQIPTRYPGRIEVYTTDNILIGYVDEELHSGLSGVIETIAGVTISSIESIDRIHARMYVPLDVMQTLPNPQNHVDYYFKEISDAAYLAKQDPLSALDMIQFAIDHEKGIYAKDVALKCYWHLKDWGARKKMALHMLEIIESMNQEELTPFSYRLFKTRKYQELIKIIATCDKKLNSKTKK